MRHRPQQNFTGYPAVSGFPPRWLRRSLMVSDMLDSPLASLVSCPAIGTPPIIDTDSSGLGLRLGVGDNREDKYGEILVL